MIATNTGLCTCDVCEAKIQIYATSFYSDRSNDIIIGDLINCLNCNVQYVYIGDATGENVFYRPNRFLTKLV